MVRHKDFSPLSRTLMRSLARLNMDPLAFRRKNHVQKGDWDPMEMEDNVEWRVSRSKRQFRSCGLPQCLEQGAAAFGWDEPFDRGDGKPIRRGRGMATAMQGSGVASFELGGASIKLNEDGSFNVMTGATDIGQGSDTILAQIAAEALGVGMDKIIMHSADTDSSVFDYGSYASSTTYISGGGVKIAAERVRKQILDVAGDHVRLRARRYVHHRWHYIYAAWPKPFNSRGHRQRDIVWQASTTNHGERRFLDRRLARTFLRAVC